jgi:tRNA U38,U39,U40 pseudouridine synthase TruA
VKWTTEDQPMMVLHELAHAYHHQVLTRGNSDVLKAFENAVKSKKYEMVPYVRGQKLRAYALTNDTEYFAELTEAYFGRNDFYPFTREELKTFDPEGYALMERIWGKPKEEIKNYERKDWPGCP